IEKVRQAGKALGAGTGVVSERAAVIERRGLARALVHQLKAEAERVRAADDAHRVLHYIIIENAALGKRRTDSVDAGRGRVDAGDRDLRESPAERIGRIEGNVKVEARESGPKLVRH